ncbi:homocysteine S-methyltransferase family protein [Variovorax sp. J22P168]|uniref:homocysteine S-methyltransferase family protein n=1 Tax=Variovorax jilinensis TaxID=3053513 RepID=UPI00257754E3|nr:homocysteine S-methyltransferase family protein [Variovorax sp. J22P168]MDM0012086.1 homocysteine S-methyltransferase family protein [Variovorax sp. J22P168]
MIDATLPQLAGGLFLSDGGLETTLVFLEGVDLPHFAAFVLLQDYAGRERLTRYYRPYLELCASTPGAGFVLETPTWRANPDWGRLLGYDASALEQANIDAARLVSDLRDEWRSRLSGPVVLSGIIGPRGDGYVADAPSSAADAAAYHLPQAVALKKGGVDMLSAVTMTTSAEAIGVARSAKAVGLPVAISFTVETDGRLPSGESLREAMEQVDADTAPAYFAVNCAHPSHVEPCFTDGGAWTARIQGIRANASTRSHAELDAATELDIGDPADLGERYRRLRTPLPTLNVLGGCCGTDDRHLRAIRDAWVQDRVT